MSIKDDFPIFKEYPNLVYLDNAATTQKPLLVIKALEEYYTKYNANVHRGLYPLSEKSTEIYEQSREIVAKFINAESNEIIFTSGTTDGLNAIASSLAFSGLLSDNPRILLSEAEHHSNILPWQRIPGVQLQYIEKLSKDDLHEFDIISLNLISNVTGEIRDIKELKSRFKSKYWVLDLAQAVGHIQIDVKNLDVDFVVFSGHKMYGPMGVGVLWARKNILETIEPFRVGGGMIREVNHNNATWSDIPNKFEAGTPDVAGVYALSKSIEYINKLSFERISNHEKELRTHLINELRQIPNINIYHPELQNPAVCVVSISIKNVHPHDLAQSLGEDNVCVRAGHHCTQILHREVLKIPASLRISCGIYNDTQDIDSFIKSLKKGISIYSIN